MHKRLFAVALLLAAPAWAGDPALAEALFQEGKKLSSEGNYAAACPKFEASYRADRTLGTLLNLADCHEHVGRIATAWAEWNEAIELAKKQDDDRDTYAAERRDKLTPRLPKLQIRVSRPAAGLEIHRGDVRIPAGAWNSALPVDPGAHEITVRRGDTVLDKRSITAEEARTASVDFDLAAIAAANPPPKDPLATRGNVRSDQLGEPEWHSQKTLGAIVAVVGVAALATGGVFELVAISEKSKADEPDQCVNKYCSSEGLESADRAKTFADVGQWVALGGLVVTGVGATLFLTAPADAPRDRVGLSVSPWLAPSGGGLGLSGAL